MKATGNRMSREENSKSQTDNGSGGSKSWRALQATVRALFFNEWDEKQLENSHQRGNPISAVSLFGLRKAPATTTSMLKFRGSLVFQRERDRDRWRRLYKWPSNQVRESWYTDKPQHSTVCIASEQLNEASPMPAAVAGLCTCCHFSQSLCGRAPLQGVHWRKELTETGRLVEQRAEIWGERLLQVLVTRNRTNIKTFQRNTCRIYWT